MVSTTSKPTASGAIIPSQSSVYQGQSPLNTTYMGTKYCHIHRTRNQRRISIHNNALLNYYLVDDIVKYREDGTPVKRPRKKAIIVHSENVATKRFWNNYTYLTEELGSLVEGINKIKPEYLRSFQFESRLMLSTWIVVGFCEDNGFQKPNDEQALKLMNSCAVSLLEMFKDIIFAYGLCFEEKFSIVSEAVKVTLSSPFLSSSLPTCKNIVQLSVNNMLTDPANSFLVRNASFVRMVESIWQLYEGRPQLVYIIPMTTKILKLKKKMNCLPSLALITMRYQLSFGWGPLFSGQSKSLSLSLLKMLCLLEVLYVVFDDIDEPTGNDRVVVEHCNIIETSFWKEHPRILDEEESLLTSLRPHSNKMLRLS
ncbi:hypothetical protein H5410_023119 [Solanum commersonii]|uniref:tRNAHis guanylyltransferase catalytic domain-containing protein n=1 Tax=Solanum commersonii TaxID=4109 RepID=A0A9J5ZJY2_SOLCO|nr:hypothetical protein H5410_023119 [Solanum commersonii]